MAEENLENIEPVDNNWPPFLNGANGNNVENNNNNTLNNVWPEYPDENEQEEGQEKPKKKKQKSYKFARELTEEEALALATPRKETPPSFSDEIQEVLELSLYNIFKKGFDQRNPGKTKEDFVVFFRELLQSHEAVLSGGFLLKTILGLPDYAWAIQNPDHSTNFTYLRKTKLDMQINTGLDIDFYVPCKHLVSFYNVMVPLFQAINFSTYEASFYCQSFLRKNGIRTVYKFFRPFKAGIFKAGINYIDIMAVRNRKSPLDVVTNFDLTVCQVWYDGVSVKGTDPEHVLHKVSFLQGDYVKTYLQGNRYLDWRLGKYTARGFKIVAQPKALLTLKPSDIVAPHQPSRGCGFIDTPRVDRPLTDDFRKRWLIRGMLRTFAKGGYTLETIGGDVRGKHEREVLYSDESKRELKQLRLLPLDGYDTDDYIEQPLKSMALAFLNQFDSSDPLVNPFLKLDPDINVQALGGYALVQSTKENLDTLLAPPAQTGGKHSTRKRR